MIYKFLISVRLFAEIKNVYIDYGDTTGPEKLEFCSSNLSSLYIRRHLSKKYLLDNCIY